MKCFSGIGKGSVDRYSWFGRAPTGGAHALRRSLPRKESRSDGYIRAGRKVAIAGKLIKITSRTISVITNGITPRKIVVKLTSFTTLLITKTFMPTGGWKIGRAHV